MHQRPTDEADTKGVWAGKTSGSSRAFAGLCAHSFTDLASLMKIKSIAVIAVSIAVNLVLGFLLFRPSAPPPPALQPDQAMVVARTPGGLLEVSVIRSEERFDSTSKHTILGVPVGTTVAQIRVPAVYRYHVALAKDWTLRTTDKAIIAIAPKIEPSLPVAIETDKLESFSSGIWSRLTGPDRLAALQRSITPHLNEKAGSQSLLLLQREMARKTVTEFVQKWVAEQKLWKGTKPPVVLVFFADEPLAIRATPLFTVP